ncbi:ATP-binding protein [Accumulibacter sp.]|uniref:ATP-binding protein n=1 Tax=Accumulibacter sp. TaxID=2053492 RepID=UPI002606E939|nr:ATP-binding protein [Accumulibacter sp.]
MTSQSYKLPFTVASALLKELGERLVGQPHIALAELIKNSYDADASRVEIHVEPNLDRIQIADNGHGMDSDEFRRFWMNIGSTHKVSQKTSRKLARPITGSKGVGRLSVQFLARTIELITVSEHDANSELRAFVDWDQAVEANYLTSAEAQINVRSCQTVFPGGRHHGTCITLERLNQSWDEQDFKSLARQVWWLQPPFVGRLREDDPNRFEIDLSGSDTDFQDSFQLVTDAALNLWHARLRGRLIRENDGYHLDLSLEFNGGKRFQQKYPIDPCFLHQVSFDIRVFHLRHRQPHGISVNDARRYLNEFGGVGIYDAGFRLPYYGPQQDWLGIELDHAHRIHTSKLLPEALQVPRGMQFLPTNSRLFGVVEVNTTQERRLATEEQLRKNNHLQIQVSRDRLVHNSAYQCLRDAVRWALDYYATREKIRTVDATPPRPDEPVRQKLQRVEEALEDFREAIPAEVFSQVSIRIHDAVMASRMEAKRALAHMELMGSLATAGMVALASEHEINQQYRILERLIGRLQKTRGLHDSVQPLVSEIDEWLNRARASRSLFAPLLDREGREERKRYRARAVLMDIARRVASLARGIPIDTEAVDDDLSLPPATLAAWNAVFQNVLLNAINALIDSNERRIVISSGSAGSGKCIWVQDTGAGVDVNEAEALFQPFERRLELTPERRQLGIGGTGLGLTIVRLLADQAGCEVGFVAPDTEFSTKFQLFWKDS